MAYTSPAKFDTASAGFGYKFELGELSVVDISITSESFTAGFYLLLDLVDIIISNELHIVDSSKVLSDTVTASESKVSSVIKYISDGSVVSEIRVVTDSKLLEDTVPIVEAAPKSLTRTFVDGLKAVISIGFNAVKWTLRGKKATTWSEQTTGSDLFTSKSALEMSWNNASIGSDLFTKKADTSTSWSKGIQEAVQDPPED